MTCAIGSSAPASSPAAFSAGEAARPARPAAVNSQLTARAILNRSLKNPARPKVGYETDSTNESSSDTGAASESSSAFADLIGRISSMIADSAASASPVPGMLSQPSARNMGTTPGKQTAATTGFAREDSASSGSPPESKPVVESGAGLPATESGSGRTAPLARESRTDGPFVPVEVATPLPSPRPKTSPEGRAGGASEAERAAPAPNRIRTAPEAALTVVIRTGEDAPAAAQDAGLQAAVSEGANNTPEESFATGQAPADPGISAPSVAEAAGSALIAASVAGTAGGAQTVPVVVDGTTGTSAAWSGPERKRLGEMTASGIVSDPGSRTAVPPAAWADAQGKGEPGRGADAPLRGDARKVSPPPEPDPAEKSTPRTLRSVALQFTPDGARDVRVRLSERAGEVHVSVHSADPALVKSLRSGVTDLAGVLAHAGYDASAWAGRQGQRQPQPQRPQEPSPRRGGSGVAAGAEDFDGLVQTPEFGNQSRI